MLSCCGALERSNNPYTESIVESCVSKNQKISDSKISSLLGFDWEENAEKGLKQWKRSNHELKAGFVYLRARKKNNIFEITLITFKVYKKCESPIQKGF